MQLKKPDIYWAVVEHIQTWIGVDGPFRNSIEQQNRNLDGVTLRRIAIAYNVNRGVRGKKDGTDKCADNLARTLNRARPWPKTLGERAQRCQEIAEKAKERNYTNGVQVSAITKFSWFAQPEDWTVYDRFVGRAMKVENKSQPMCEFYRELERRGFLALAGEVQSALKEVRGMDLYGARVLDKLMMLKGADHAWGDNMRSSCQGFIDVLPRHWRLEVEGAAERVVDGISPSNLKAFF